MNDNNLGVDNSLQSRCRTSGSKVGTARPFLRPYTCYLVVFLLGVGGKLCSLMGHLSRELVAESRILLSEYDLMSIAWPTGTFAAKLRKLVAERKRETVSCEWNGTACVCK